ncbi:Mediator Of Rna polymerase Ii Transcription Subunit 16 [Manis pentadactyla]|nr:Mediator Of Rna polymerase Ii Transcription Subunit 16 [Manis pentadactyla]
MSPNMEAPRCQENQAVVLTGPPGSQAALCTVHQDRSLPHKEQDLGAVSLLLTKVLTTGKDKDGALLEITLVPPAGLPPDLANPPNCAEVGCGEDAGNGLHNGIRLVMTLSAPGAGSWGSGASTVRPQLSLIPCVHANPRSSPEAKRLLGKLMQNQST